MLSNPVIFSALGPLTFTVEWSRLLDPFGKSAFQQKSDLGTDFSGAPTSSTSAYLLFFQSKNAMFPPVLSLAKKHREKSTFSGMFRSETVVDGDDESWELTAKSTTNGVVTRGSRAEEGEPTVVEEKDDEKRISEGRKGEKSLNQRLRKASTVVSEVEMELEGLGLRLRVTWKLNKQRRRRLMEPSEQQAASVRLERKEMKILVLIGRKGFER
ncbi:hypothetical protein F3Y22_tig00110840pilonHSYRG00047 [Hibiscus syriacus]|uniref:Uncharacterized protein n=1 Tax=Hibiscus syriacus TaxID=106335 RepID=A0A6A2ZKR7_HIBSY|nr:hypothetical protein F3Y22_tig00110840pilonHSYRG00047 [Hibiscus syriacus]